MDIKRNHPLFIGEIVFDYDLGFFGVIVELTDTTAVLDMNGIPKKTNVKRGWCEMENKIAFDSEITEEETIWTCDNLVSLYQVAWGIMDKRTENIVCYEHIITENGYPYFSPYLEENLYNFEVEER